jgi:hypothetical protein
MPPSTRHAKSGDVHLAYQVVGDAPLDLVFVHGWVSNVEYGWESVGDIKPVLGHEPPGEASPRNVLGTSS